MKNDDGGEPPLTADQAAEQQRARDRMIARHKLIEAMIRNNELQLRNESARGGAEIEMHCALRDNALPGAGVRSIVEDGTRDLAFSGTPGRARAPRRRARMAQRRASGIRERSID